MRAAGALASAALLLPVVTAGPAATAGQRAPGVFQRQVTDAANRYHVPSSVLLGVAYLESRWDGHSGSPSVGGGYGPMHLTDAATALASAPHHSDATEDARGDAARPRPAVRVAAPAPERGALPARLRTLDRAAELTGMSPERLRRDPAANLQGGAALLAAEQKRLGLPLSDDAADWYGAVAAYAGATDRATARTFADDVYEVIRSGQRRRTDAGQDVALPGSPGLAPRTEQVDRLGLGTVAAAGVECPPTVACESIPAPYQQLEGKDYGNHDVENRPASQKVDFIVIHDTEGTWETTIKLIKDPAYVSWNYTIRSGDGHVAQHVQAKDVAWHAGNWYVNSKSVGIEHEGFLAQPDAWYTEEMYRTSARLVRYLAQKLDVPLDRQHILGHDNVPGTTPATIKGMHTDPGPYWDWAHYFELLGRPFRGVGSPFSGMVTISPDYDDHTPVYTGCAKPGEQCAAHGSGAVRLHVAPRDDAPLVRDVGLRPDGSPSTVDVNDTGARASTGQQFAVAGREGGWTAIWYLGQKAWFRNPWWDPTAVGAHGRLVTPKEGLGEIPVYGRAYPEQEAYPEGVPVQAVTPLPYKLQAGQAYVLGQTSPGEYLWAATFEPAGHRVVRGKEVYYEIQFGHRVAFVRASDVSVRDTNW
ncbi:N-acetylmuramoyl-L-alanine amidase [Streptomyces cinnamoneus]|uniref:N-acetylmuramoyl-L-alanine amidase n=1 Tax=Streptomyces cinnamoneus TaxID=53446 RepID=A0A2G1XL10_STRCJ|nr:N-acetylmuramoyl-L-alanine amidase [Streptomyces cinnamoneus]PHQ51861.1 N-acetylmuramoyl-L-alanine amidase [Streptomyces cinnamoneus]PPT16325.1 N-acetylmuramoyl-L-alanine amidase [Streptomyces cinnamoneus]